MVRIRASIGVRASFWDRVRVGKLLGSNYHTNPDLTITLTKKLP